MIRSIVLAIALLPVSMAYAQTTSPFLRSTKELNKHRQLIGQLVRQQHSNIAEKTTAVKERVIAMAEIDNTQTPPGIADSATYSYSGSRGSAYDYDDIEYNSQYPYFGSPMFDYGGHYNKPMILCDTTKVWFPDNNTGLFSYQEQTITGYDGNNNIITFNDTYTDTVDNTNGQYVNTFDGNNDVTYSLAMSDTGMGMYDSTLRRYYSYDGQNRITQDSSYDNNAGVWQPYVKYVYTYDNNGNIIQIDGYQGTGGAWSYVAKYLNTYTINNQLQRVETDYLMGNTWTPYMIDTFGYTTGISYHTYWKEYANTGNSLDSVLVLTYHINQQGVPDSIQFNTDDQNNLWQRNLLLLTYNSFNDPTTAMLYPYNNNVLSDTPSIAFHYYYETYHTEGVESVTAQNVKVYPNPTTAVLNVQIANGAVNNIMTLRLVNAAGQTVRTEAVAGNSGQLSVRNLSPGVYWLMVQDNNGSTIHKQSIVKE